MTATLLLSPGLARAQATLPPAVGYNYGQMETARVAAMGGAQRATSLSIGALFSNPANMAAARVYHVGALAQIWPEAARQSYGGGIVDSVVSSQRIAGGFGGNWTQQDPDGIQREGYDLRFGLAYPFSDKFYLGVTGRYLEMRQDGLGPLGRSLASGGTPGAPVATAITFDAGMTLKPIDSLAFSVVGYNLTNPNHGLLPTTVAGAAAFGTRELTLEADVVGDFSTYGEARLRAMGGFEILFGDHFPVRLGYRWDQGAESHAVSGGFGYLAREFGAEVAVRRTVVGDEATTVVIGLRLHLEATGLTPTPSAAY